MMVIVSLLVQPQGEKEAPGVNGDQDVSRWINGYVADPEDQVIWQQITGPGSLRGFCPPETVEVAYEVLHSAKCCLGAAVLIRLCSDGANELEVGWLLKKMTTGKHGERPNCTSDAGIRAGTGTDLFLVERPKDEFEVVLYRQVNLNL